MVRHGAKACIVSRTQERLDKAAREMMSSIKGAEVLPVAADVRKPEDLERAVAKCVEKFGRIDVGFSADSRWPVNLTLGPTTVPDPTTMTIIRQIVVCGAAGNFLAPTEKLSYNAFKVRLAPRRPSLPHLTMDTADCHRNRPSRIFQHLQSCLPLLEKGRPRNRQCLVRRMIFREGTHLTKAHSLWINNTVS